MRYYLYNSLSSKIDIIEDACTKVEDVIDLDYASFIDSINDEDEIMIVGGEGTLNFFINAIKNKNINCKVHYKPTLTNDFILDLNVEKQDMYLINDYIKDLPTIYVKELEQLFINSIGFGLDSFSEMERHILKKQTKEDVSLQNMMFKKLLHYKPRHVTLTVDGVEYKINHAWFMTTLKGKYYFNGKKLLIEQDRTKDTLTLVVIDVKSKLKAIKAFSDLNNENKTSPYIHTFVGSEFFVKSDKSTPLSIDGEIVPDVIEYKITCK